MSEFDRCSAITTAGAPCPNRTLPHSSFCFAHDPALAARREDARRKGGAATRRSERLARMIPGQLQTVYTTLETALAEVHDGTITPSVANAMAAIASAMVRTLTAGEMEERLRALENRRNGTE